MMNLVYTIAIVNFVLWTIVCTIENCTIEMFFYALLQWTSFVSTIIALDKLFVLLQCMHFSHFYLWQLFYLPYVIDKYFMNSWNWRCFCSTIAVDDIRCNIPVESDNFLCTIGIHKFCMCHCSPWLLYLLVWLREFAPTNLYE